MMRAPFFCYKLAGLGVLVFNPQKGARKAHDP